MMGLLEVPSTTGRQKQQQSTHVSREKKYTVVMYVLSRMTGILRWWAFSEQDDG